MKLSLAVTSSFLVELCFGLSKDYFTPTIVSWGAPRIDLFGITPKGNVWHKYQTTNGWEPHSGPGSLEIFDHASSKSSASAVSWGPNRVNFVFIDTDGLVRHKYWYGSGWGPQTGFESLGRGPVDGVKITSWGENRLDIVGLSKNGTLLHKAWTGSSWYPGVEEWEDLGGVLVQEPAAVSWGIGRLDIFGITKNGTIAHKYWNGQWQPEGQDWEDLGGKNLKSTLTVSSPSTGRVDVWTVGESDELYHLFWDGSSWQGWHSLGGEFSDTPQIVHYSPDNIDIIGRFSANKSYAYKHWDGGSWSGWHEKGGPFASEPAGIRLGDDNLQIIGITEDGKVQFQSWNGKSWFPGPASWYEIADLKAAKAVMPGNNEQMWDEKLLMDEDL